MGLALSYFLPNTAPITSEAESRMGAIIAPSMTVSGLFATFVPLISFFFVAEMKEEEKSSVEAIREDSKEFTGEEDSKMVASMVALAQAFWYNTRVAVLEYTRIYTIISLTSLPMLIVLYVALTPIQFFIADICVLFIILTGIYTVITVALSKSVRKLKEITESDRANLS